MVSSRYSKRTAAQEKVVFVLLFKKAVRGTKKRRQRASGWLLNCVDVSFLYSVSLYKNEGRKDVQNLILLHVLWLAVTGVLVWLVFV